MTVVQLYDVTDPDDVWDTVTFADDGEITYDTGDARSMVEARRPRAADQAELIASFDGWSNGYAATRLVQPSNP